MGILIITRTHHSSNGKDSRGDEGDIFSVKEVCRLEQVGIGHAVFHASLLESEGEKGRIN